MTKIMPPFELLPRYVAGRSVRAVIMVCIAVPCVWVSYPFVCSVAEDTISPTLKRVAPLEPDEALKTFELPPGFELQRTAEEPLVIDPVAMAFDENGRLYVVEMRGYSEQRDDQLGRIRLLEDRDQDGHFDSATVFADNLLWPTAVTCFHGGVFVGAAPDILYFKDTDGDGIADERRVVLTGFGTENVQGLLNSFRWGPDNRIHGATSSAGGSVKQPDQLDSARINLRGRNFSFDPWTGEIRPESGGGQHGMSFDDWGRKFVCSNSRHADFIVYDDRYLSRNPELSAPAPLMNIAADGGQAEVFRSSPVEAWRVIRTRMRVEGVVNGIVEGGGRAAGYFTGASGITIYRGDAYDDSLHGIAVIGDVGSNIVHRKRLTPEGVVFTATRMDQNSEFLRSSDIWFRPVQFENGPDGCLHVLDMYREVIEHPHSIPLNLKQQLDLTSGRDRGRLYRIAPEGFVYQAPPRMGEMKSAELCSFLSHPNAWHRESASRLLFERQDKSVIPQLRDLARHGKAPLGRWHAANVLMGMNAMDEETLCQLLADAHPRVRERALVIAESFSNSSRVTAAVGKLVDDPDLRVQVQLGFSAGEFPSDVRVDWLSRLLSGDAQDEWLRLAVLSSAADVRTPLLKQLVKAQPQSTSLSPVTRDLVRQIGRANQSDQIDGLLHFLETDSRHDPYLQSELLVELLTSCRADRVKQIVKGSRSNFFAKLLEQARKAIGNPQSPQQCLQALRILSVSPGLSDSRLIAGLLEPQQGSEIHAAAFQALSHFHSPETAQLVLDRWNQFSPSTRLQAEELLFSREEWIAALFDRLEDGDISPKTISPARLQAVLKGSNADLRERGHRIERSMGPTSRQAVIKAYASALTLKGSATSGRNVFRKTCTACHRLEGTGRELGPNLAAISNRGKEAILMNILDPNREVNPQYLNYLVAMQQGQVHTGMIQSETATSLTLIRAEAEPQAVLRTEIDEIQSTGLSLMPEGLERQIDQQQMADLLAYLFSVASPTSEN